MSQDWKSLSASANAGKIPSSTPISANGDGWTLVQRHPPKKQHVVQQVAPFTNAFLSDNYNKTNQDTSYNAFDSEIIVKKRIHPESLQALIRTRIIMMLNQTKADQFCCFQPHTFRDIECNRCLPTEKQHSVIQKLLGVQLRIESTF